jgi:sulfur dioxygenase
MLIFRQLIDQPSSTYTYLLGDSESGECILIDPVFEQANRDRALVSEIGLRLVATVDTHVHADHITGAWLLKQTLGSEIVLSRDSGADGGDRYVSQGDEISFGNRTLLVRSTPGHTDGCITLVIDDNSMAFTGDCLLIRGSGRTDFQQGSPDLMYESVRREIFSLPDTCLLYPGHDYRGLTASSVAEEKAFNPRLGGDIDLHDFSGYMKNLKLPHPKQIDRAVPANLKCGRPDTFDAQDTAPDWANLKYTFSGIWEIEAPSLEEVLPMVQVVDVRELSEYDGSLGRIKGSKLIPLDELMQRAGELDSNLPVVTVCRSGARSAQAVAHLTKVGFKKIANLSGGMLRWRDGGHSVEGGQD